MSAPLIDEILDLIFEAVNMRHVNKAELSAETPLMAGGLGLDSIDILEVVIALEKRYDLKIENNDESRKIFKDLGSLATFVETHRRNPQQPSA